MNSTDNQIYLRLIGNGIPSSLANIIVAQARHETGNYTSNAFVKDNNLFGYKYVGQTGAIQGIKSSEGDYYAHYRNIEGSVDELCRWINRRQKEGIFPKDLNKINTAQKYATYLKDAGYYGASVSNYVLGILNGLKKAGFAIASPNSVVAIIFVAFIITMLFYTKTI